MNSFIKGTFVLMLVIFLSKILGFIYRMQFMRIAGEEAVGIYMTAYPAFIFFIAVVQLGIPVAVAKLIAEYSARNKLGHMQAVLRTAGWITASSIFLVIPLLVLITPLMAVYLFQNNTILWTLYVGLATVPIVVVASVWRAYLQGLARITPTAFAQLFEQLVRITLTIGALPLVIAGQSAAQIAAYAMVITALGELFSLLFISVPFFWAKRQYRTSEQASQVAKPILRLALPSAGSRLFGSFTWFLEPIVFLKALTVSGMTAGGAMTLYGIISGVHIPLLLFPSFVSSALAIVLIPAVSDAIARANSQSLQQRISISLRLSSMIGCFAATFFFLYGDELTLQLFHLEDDRGYMRILAPIFYFYYVQSPLHAILQAVDEAKLAMMNSIYGGLGKLLLLFVLASQPFFQEKGAILAIGFGVLVTSFLHIAAIRQHPKINIGYQIFLVPYAIFLAIVSLQTFFPLPLSLELQYLVTLGSITTLLVLFRQIKRGDFALVSRLFTRL